MADKIDLVPLLGSYLPPVARAERTDADVAGREIEVSIWLRRKPTGKELPDPGAKDFKAIDRDAFAESWGASQEDVDVVMDYLKKDVDADIKLVSDKPDRSLARRLVRVKARVKSLEKDFGVRIEEARLASGETVLLRTGEINIPRRLEGIVLGVFGLDTRPIGTRGPAKLMSAEVDPTTLPTPPDIAKLYRFPEPAGGTAKGQVIALMQFGGGYDPDHPKQYFDDLGVSQPTLIDYIVPGGSNTPGSKYDKEVTLDIEVAGSVAVEATIVTYFAPHTEDGWITAIAAAVDDTTNRPYIMSISWGAPELGVQHAHVDQERNGRDEHQSSKPPPSR